MELVVHADDLACGVGLPTPEFPEEVTAPVVELLARLAVRRHGVTDVVRALSPAERAPASIAGIQAPLRTAPPPPADTRSSGRSTGG